jgi:hypothetical protein
MNRAAIIPPIASDDHLPDDRAVWREPPCAAPGHVKITVQYGDSAKERTTVAEACWPRVQRYRFGWAPPRAVDPFEGLGLAAKE